MTERQITFAQHGHVLTNCGVWSADSQWIVYDTRSDPAGAVFDGRRIERIHVPTGRVELLYESTAGACCGVATFHPLRNQVIFIRGPEHPSPDWNYGPARRQGVIVDIASPGKAIELDARDIQPPFTAGALRGGSHVHVFSPDGRFVSFTYEDAVLERFERETDRQQMNLRCVAVTQLGTAVTVPTGPRNHSGIGFSAVVTAMHANALPGSDQIDRAVEEGWIGSAGYRRADGSIQRYALASAGRVTTAAGDKILEVFIIDLPDALTTPGVGPLQGDEYHRPYPPAGVTQRRLTFTDHRLFPGLQGPRHWLRSNPDGSAIAFLMRDDRGVVQLCSISPLGRPVRQITNHSDGISSAFTWSPDGRYIAAVMDDSVFTFDVTTGRGTRMTPRLPDASPPLPEACVFSPDGKWIAYVRQVAKDQRAFNQVFVCSTS